MVKKILLSFAVWKILALFFAYLAIFFLPLNKTFSAYQNYEPKQPYFVWIWGNFDGVHYIDIARRGYFRLEQPFFPFFPLLLGNLARKFHLPYVVSGQIISSLAFFFSLIVLYKILLIDKKTRLFPLMLFIMIAFPTSFFYGAVYNDSLFFLLAATVVYLARKRRWFLSSLTAIFATLTRLNGLALPFFIFTEYLISKKEGWDFKNLIQKFKTSLSLKNIIKSKIFSIIFPFFAFLGYLSYVQNKFGDWNLTFSTMKIWNQDKMVFPLQTVWRYIKILFLYPTFKLNYWVAALEFTFVLFYLFLIVYSWKKIRLSYWIFFTVSILIPSLTGSFQGMPRYGLHLYPFFLTLALLLENKSFLLKFFYFTISALIMLFCITLFTRGYFVA